MITLYVYIEDFIMANIYEYLYLWPISAKSSVEHFELIDEVPDWLNQIQFSSFKSLVSSIVVQSEWNSLKLCNFYKVMKCAVASF